jgi:acyl dehydratase
MGITVEHVDALHDHVGGPVVFSDWQRITQERIDLFADATGDHQWIHCDLERAAHGPFGGPIAHGYLTLALAPDLLGELVQIETAQLTVNYGCNKVRFPAPVPVGSSVRMGVTLAETQEVEGGVQATFDLVFEIKDAPKPACVAQVVYRYYR